jgi:ADP-heptose:LPS heptosyltransferase
LKTLLARLAAVAPKPYPSDVERILVVREGGFGDILLLFPLLRAIRASAGADVMIDVLVRERVALLLAENDIIDQLYAKGSNLRHTLATIRAMRSRRYQVVIDLVSSPSLSFALWILAAAPRAHRVGGDKAELRQMYHQHVDLPPRPSIHFMERLRRIASFAIGDTPVRDEIPWLDWPESVCRQAESVWQSLIPPPQMPERTGVVLVNLSAGQPQRTWPVESYRQLLPLLIAKYGNRIHRWILTSTPEDRPKAAALVAAMDRSDVVLLPPQSDFRVVIELAGRVNLVFTPDTSLLHAASAYGVPVVVFFVAEKVISWAPWKIPSAVVSAPEGQPVAAIPVEEMAAAFDRIMPQLSSQQRSHRGDC